MNGVNLDEWTMVNADDYDGFRESPETAAEGCA
jgi:hypothetical protein